MRLIEFDSIFYLAKILIFIESKAVIWRFVRCLSKFCLKKAVV